jgi:hypothetical protein
VQGVQVAHVVFGVVAHGGGQRAARPVREAFVFGEADVQQGLHQRAVPGLQTVARESGGDLRVVEWGGRAAHPQREDFDVLRAGVNDLDDVGAQEQFAQGVAIRAEGGDVHQCDAHLARRVPDGELDDFEQGGVSALPDELGVHREARILFERRPPVFQQGT